MYRNIVLLFLAGMALCWLPGCNSEENHQKHPESTAVHKTHDEHQDASLHEEECTHDAHNPERGAVHEEEHETHASGHEEEHDDDHDSEDNHEGHAEDHHENEDAHDDHDVHDEHDDHSTHQDNPEIVLSAKALEIAGITIEKVKKGNISKTVELAGEVGFDEDRLTHIVPRFPGIVKQVYKKLGDNVKAGEVLASIESNESMSSYKIKALIAGTVIEKHITLGEFVSEETAVFVIADLSRIWVNLAVYAKDIQNIRLGQHVKIEAVGSQVQGEGKISYIRPVFDEQTRNSTARIVLPNTGNKWRPGSFVRASIKQHAPDVCLIIEESAIQLIEGTPRVFIPVPGERNTFAAISVKLGDRDEKHAEILSGLAMGTPYVSNGAFELKSEMVTSSLGGHAGHGH
ncbi:MAG: efflux RND transporter periplasmic adaptor subunit [Fibrobacteria bacterium]|nr:efflux RND transporter periplasmic adaptor subunit [Fibrobacteria bacterium]